MTHHHEGTINLEELQLEEEKGQLAAKEEGQGLSPTCE